MEAVLPIEIMYEHQSNLEEKVNPSILKDFPSRTDPSIFTSIAPALSAGQMKPVALSGIEINKSLPAPVHIVS